VEGRLREDLEAGHVKVLGELIGASATDPALKTEVAALLAPWLELTEETVARLLDPSPVGGLLPPRQVAFVVLATFLGVQQMISLTGDVEPIRQLFATARGVSPLLEAGGGGSGSSSSIPTPALVAGVEERS
jgi:hypothetical protein